MTEHKTWLTQDAFDRLKAELEDRTGPQRVEITKRIELARQEGDLSENAGYHAAREAQGMNEARIRHLSHFLEHAEIGAPEVEDGVAAVGRIVIVEFDDGEQEKFLLGSRVESAPEGAEVLSPSSPLGAAVIGKRVGDDVTYALANGRSVTVTIADIA
jgi:transcription elongation factor GreA